MLRNFDLQLDSPTQVLFKNLSREGGPKLRRSPVYSIHGNELKPLTGSDIIPGQVFAISGKQNISTGDVIGPNSISGPNRFKPNKTRKVNQACSVSLEAMTNKDRSKLIQRLEILVKEDPSLSFDVADDIVLRGIGTFHLEIAISRLKNEHKINKQLRKIRNPKKTQKKLRTN